MDSIPIYLSELELVMLERINEPQRFIGVSLQQRLTDHLRKGHQQLAERFDG